MTVIITLSKGAEGGVIWDATCGRDNVRGWQRDAWDAVHAALAHAKRVWPRATVVTSFERAK